MVTPTKMDETSLSLKEQMVIKMLSSSDSKPAHFETQGQAQSPLKPVQFQSKDQLFSCLMEQLEAL